MIAELDERLAELYQPGGISYDETREFPYLVDFECSSCGRIGGCSAECPNRVTTIETKEEPLLQKCKFDGCDGEIVQQKGPYGGCCEPHRAEKMAARAAARTAPEPEPPEPEAPTPEPAQPDLPGALLVRARATAQGDADLERILAETVFRTKEAVEAAVVVAAGEFAREIAGLLRERIADAIRGD